MENHKKPNENWNNKYKNTKMQKTLKSENKKRKKLKQKWKYNKNMPKQMQTDIKTCRKCKK